MEWESWDAHAHTHTQTHTHLHIHCVCTSRSFRPDWKTIRQWSFIILHHLNITRVGNVKLYHENNSNSSPARGSYVCSRGKIWLWLNHRARRWRGHLNQPKKTWLTSTLKIYFLVKWLREDKNINLTRLTVWLHSVFLQEYPKIEPRQVVTLVYWCLGLPAVFDFLFFFLFNNLWQQLASLVLLPPTGWKLPECSVQSVHNVLSNCPHPNYFETVIFVLL